MVFNPSYPAAGPWFTPTGSPSGVPSWEAMYGVSPQTAVQLAGRQPTQPNAGQQQGAAEAARAAEEARKWDEYVKTLRDAMQASAGWEREKNRLALQDAEKGRQNAYRIAELQAQTSRYGTDRNAEVELARLKENQRQFDANHALEQQKFGLSVADAYTRYAQTYDDIWALQDFKGALGRVGLGQAPTSVAMQSTQPRAKTWEDFTALSGYGGPAAAPAPAATVNGGGMQTGWYRPEDRPATGVTAAPAAPTWQDFAAQTGYGSLPTVQAGRTTPSIVEGQGAVRPGAMVGTGTDPRISAASAVMKALPPSETSGTDDQDWAALNAIKSLYFGRKPGQVERLGQERQRIARAGLARLGYNPALVEEDRQRSLPRQGRVNAA